VRPATPPRSLSARCGRALQHPWDGPGPQRGRGGSYAWDHLHPLRKQLPQAMRAQPTPGDKQPPSTHTIAALTLALSVSI